MKVENGNISGTVELDMNSFTCTDLEGKKSKNLTNTLSSDFLDVEVYPTSEVSILSIKVRTKTLKLLSL